MARTNVLLVIQISGYFIGLILSFCIVVPMSLHQADFDGNCLLFSKGMWNEESKVKKMLVTWAPPIYCHYVLFVGVIMMITCCIQIYRLLMLWYEERDTSFLSTFLEAVGCLALCVLVVIAAIIVTLGFLEWCQSVSPWFQSCQDSAGQVMDYIDAEWTESFYSEIDAAQLGSWAAFTTFVALVVASTLKFLRNHELQNMYAVMSRGGAGVSGGWAEASERQPLLNSGWPEEGQSTPPELAEPYTT